MYLLDTNVLSELRREDRADRHVWSWATGTPVQQFWVSSMSIFEIERGILRVERRDAVQAARLRSWLDRVLQLFEGRVLPVDVTVARRCAALHVPDPRPERDAFIAATALSHGLTVVTRNVADFEPMGVALLNPWIAIGGSTP
jgi:predicted nucleic acid-binding protein